MPFVVQPVVVPRAEHSISRSQIDPDALKVLYRLHQNDFVAYLVGGSVRDLLLERRPKDFDIGTSAHPYQVKRLFRNCCPSHPHFHWQKTASAAACSAGCHLRN